MFPVTNGLLGWMSPRLDLFFEKCQLVPTFPQPGVGGGSAWNWGWGPQDTCPRGPRLLPSPPGWVCESPALQQAPWEWFRIAKPSQVDEGTAKASDGPWLEGSGDPPLLTEVEDLHVTE